MASGILRLDRHRDYYRLLPVLRDTGPPNEVALRLEDLDGGAVETELKRGKSALVPQD